MDARWTRKGREFHFGYKDHVKAGADSKLITDYTVTPANVHDSQPMPAMINEKDKKPISITEPYSFGSSMI